MDPVAFVKESYQELRKSTWLPRQQAVGSTFVVIILVALIGLYAAAIDFVLSTVLRALLGG